MANKSHQFESTHYTERCGTDNLVKVTMLEVIINVDGRSGVFRGEGEALGNAPLAYFVRISPLRCYMVAW